MRKLLSRGAVAVFVSIMLFAIGAELYVRSLGPRARIRAIHALQDRFDADVQLKDLQLSLLPHPTVFGTGITLRHKTWKDPQPLISIGHFTAQSGFWNLFFQRDHVRSLKLEGLQIHTPPRGESATKIKKQGNEPVESEEPGHDRSRLRILIDTIVADGAVLEVAPREARKKPLLFRIRKLTLHSVGAGEPMKFDATLENAKPPGLIVSKGEFGPWQKDDPRASAVSGDYTFQNADLGVFKGIRGILSSAGAYRGVLQHIDINGKTDTPDFALKRTGAPVHLKTVFHAIVNGMNGDTILDPVDAHFLASEFLCKGGVIKEEGDKGKTVTLDATAKQARMEDILQLVLGDKTPAMTGDVHFDSKIIIPPGHEPVLDKLQLKGKFLIESAVFTNSNAEEKIDTLSARARGISKDEEARQPVRRVASDLLGQFKLNKGIARFSEISFEVPGAQVRLKGNYNLRSEQIDMAGLFRMRATLSDTQSGVTHWLLKPLDPIFAKHGIGFELPLKIGGTKKHPTVDVTALHHSFNVK